MSLATSGDPILIPQARSLRFFFTREPLHYAALAGLAAITWFLARGFLGNGEWQGISDTTWFWLAIAIPVAHVTYVWIGWRLQLGWNVFTKIFGKYDLLAFRIGFEPFLLARALVLVALGLSDANTLGAPLWMTRVTAWALLLPALYAGYSAIRYFGFFRAVGADHFRAEYRDMPFVREGAFKYTGNAMYAMVFLVFWSIAFFTDSMAALYAAFFHHAAIWVHYYCTEKPDIALIYGSRQTGNADAAPE